MESADVEPTNEALDLYYLLFKSIVLVGLVLSLLFLSALILFVSYSVW